MSTQLGGQPILILKEGSSRTRGRDAQGMNIAAAKAVANAVRTTLGPKGMDKMLVDSIGDVVITNDGVTGAFSAIGLTVYKLCAVVHWNMSRQSVECLGGSAASTETVQPGCVQACYLADDPLDYVKHFIGVISVRQCHYGYYQYVRLFSSEIHTYP